MQTLLLDRTAWDLVIDASGDIAVASEPYSIAQDAASEARLFAGELWYDTTQGIPYFSQVLGQAPPLQFMRAQYVAAAEKVPDVASAQCFFSGIAGRRLAGQIQITTSTGAVQSVGF